MSDDANLLRRYAEDRSEADFTAWVQRHFDLVYSAALRHLQGDHQLHAIRPPVPAVAAPGSWILFDLSFEIRTGQIVEQYFEIGAEQIGPLLLQVYE